MTATRINEDLELLAGFGRSGPAVRRLAWSDAHREALAWLGARMESAGLVSEIDAAGNLVARWDVGEGPALLLGSHVDSGPHAGRFDGCLGVLGALAAVELLQAWGSRPRRPIWIASFMDEEGVRFGASMLGSRAFVGDDVTEMLERTDADGVSIARAMASWGRDPARVSEAAAIDRVGDYLELHIEQGPVLERTGAELGVVTGIAGMIQVRVRLRGEANHAGTTPMDMRRDAMMGAARIALALREEALALGDATLTVGSLDLDPGAFTVIPGRADLTVDFRCAPQADFSLLEPLVAATVERVAAEEGLDAEIDVADSDPPVALDAGVVDVVARAAARESARVRRMPSGAGHDAMVIARHVPAGMLFVPSRGGISHSPEEHTDPEHCELGVRTLARAIQELAC